MKTQGTRRVVLLAVTVAPLLMATAAIMVKACDECWDVDYPWCDELFEQEWLSCEERCGSEAPGGCDSIRGYYVYAIPTAVTSDYGYWDYNTGVIGARCADIYLCVDSDDPCSATRYWCNTSEYSTFCETEYQYGLDYSCPGEG